MAIGLVLVDLPLPFAALAFGALDDFLALGAFGLADPPFLGVLAFGFLSFLAGLEFLAGEVVAATAGASTLGASTTGAGAALVFGALALGALGVFGLLEDLALDLLAFWD